MARTGPALAVAPELTGSLTRAGPLAALRQSGARRATAGVRATVALARVAERSGFSGFFVTGPERGHRLPQGPEANGPAAPGPAFPVRAADPFVVLGAVAARSEHLTLGHLWLRPGGRPASLLAKAAAGLDVCSEGRGLLCLGLDPGRASGSPVEALARLAESLEVCRALATVRAPRLAGRYEQLEEAWNEPRWPRASGSMPLGLLVGPGGDSEDGLGAMLVLAARFAEVCLVDVEALRPRGPADGRGPSWSLDDSPGAIATRVADVVSELERAGRHAGRVPGSIDVRAWIRVGERTTSVVLGEASACRAAGTKSVVLDFGTRLPPAGELEILARALT